MSKDRKKPARSKQVGATTTGRRRPAGPSKLQRVRAAAPAVLRRMVGVSLICGTVGVAALAVVYGKDFLAHASARPVNSISVQGQFAHISQEEISDSVAPMIVGGFLQSPLSAIKEQLELHPWISRATVSRRWPDKLHITIVEEQPIARWGKMGFLNHRGDLIKVSQNDRLGSLPLLSGKPGQEHSVMQHYQQLAQMFGPYGVRINEFHSNEMMSRQLVLEGGLTIHLGRDQTMEKIQRFLVVYNRELQKRMDEIASVDLRYGNGLAVRWKDGSEAGLAQVANR